MTTITFEDDALLKLLLHASRHTATPVCGVCLGKRSQGSIRMVDTVPLFHSHSVLGPLAQTALIQVRCSAPGLCARFGTPLVGRGVGSSLSRSSNMNAVSTALRAGAALRADQGTVASGVL